MKPREDSSRISPTAHYTAYVWVRHGLAPAALATPQGAVMFRLLQPFAYVGSLTTRGVTLEKMLLQRHTIIDHLLAQAVEAGRVHQVLEIAGGLTGRGVRFMRRYGRRGLGYIEGDLPDMVARKKARLQMAGHRLEGHEVVPLDALADEGPLALAEVIARWVAPDRGLAIITEGLLSYFDRDTVEALWRRLADVAAPFPQVQMLTDLHLGQVVGAVPAARVFRRFLGLVAGGTVHVHWERSDEITAALHRAGWARVSLHRPSRLGHLVDCPDTGPMDAVLVGEAWRHDERQTSADV